MSMVLVMTLLGWRTRTGRNFEERQIHVIPSASSTVNPHIFLVGYYKCGVLAEAFKLRRTSVA